MTNGQIFALLFFVIVVAVPTIVGVGGNLIERWIKMKEKQLELAASEAADKAATQAAHIERLEQRMRVMERIATDKGASLSAEIEDLRDGSSRSSTN